MTPTERSNVYFTNVVLLLMAIAMILLIVLKAYLLIQVPLILISHTIGLWLFYIQHQFEDVSWDRTGGWDYKTTAIEGNSFLKLPAVIQWFTGNIGFHHVHHLSPRIPIIIWPAASTKMTYSKMSNQSRHFQPLRL